MLSSNGIVVTTPTTTTTTTSTSVRQYPQAPADGRIIPIHYVDDVRVLRPKNYWSKKALEAVIGRPDEYASQNVRLFVVLPRQDFNSLNIGELIEGLTTYASDPKRNLNIELTYYPGATAVQLRINPRPEDPEQQRVFIDIFGREIINHLTDRGDVGQMVLTDMCLVPGWSYAERSRNYGMPHVDIDAMAPDARLSVEPNPERDYNMLVVHRIVEGNHDRTLYPLIKPAAYRRGVRVSS
jgi:hypothetical protein